MFLTQLRGTDGNLCCKIYLEFGWCSRFYRFLAILYLLYVVPIFFSFLTLGVYRCLIGVRSCSRYPSRFSMLLFLRQSYSILV